MLYFCIVIQKKQHYGEAIYIVGGTDVQLERHCQQENRDTIC